MANSIESDRSPISSIEQELTASHVTHDEQTGSKEDFQSQLLPAKGLEHYLQEQEKNLIITALKQTGWNKTQAAELLGTTFRSLRYRMKKLDIAEDQAD